MREENRSGATAYTDTSTVLATPYQRAAAVKRISWAAVFAGVIIVLVIQLMLSVLGIGIGASTIDPLTDQNLGAGISTGAGIWFVITSLIALFAGGWVAGRLAGMPRHTDSLLHGVLTWGLATLLLFYFLTSTVGALIGGTFRVLGSGLSTAATANAPAVAGAVRDVAGAVRDEAQERGVNLDPNQETRARATQQARETGDAAARGISKAALWTFIVLLVSAAAAAAGGYIATPRDLTTTRTSAV